MMKSRAGNFSFYVLIYFFLIFHYLLSSSSGAPPPIIFTIGIDPNIKIEDMEYEEIRKAVRDACYAWNDTGVVLFVYNPHPKIRIRAKKLQNEDQRIGQFNMRNGCVEINNSIYPLVNHRRWNRELLKRTLIHELGHAMGLLKHSEDPNDIMYFRVNDADKPSANDVRRLKEKLYR